MYGKWSVQTNQQTNKHTHMRAQCSHASVGLAQARPNYKFGSVNNESHLSVIGASVSEPHTSEFYCNFSYIFFLSYVVPYILDAVI